MKTKHYFTASMALAFSFLFLISCQKERDENDNTNCAVSMTNLSGTYKLVSLKYKMSSSSPEQDYMLFFDDCEKDDLIKLNANGTYEYKDMGTVCSPSGSDTGTWSVVNNQLYSDGIISGEVESFDCTKLVTVLKDLNVEGDRITFTLQKQ